MIKITRRIFIHALYISTDVLFMGLAIYLAALIRESTLPFDITFHNLFWASANTFRFIFYFWILVVVILNKSYGLYETKRELFEPLEIWRVIKSILLSAIITIVAIYVIKTEGFPRTVVFLTTGFAAVFLSVWRIFKRFFVNYMVAHGYNNFNILIIGAGKVGRSLKSEIERRPWLGLKIIGFLDDFGDIKTDASAIIGKLDDFSVLARREFIDQIYITAHLDEQKYLKLLRQANEIGTSVRVVPQGFELMSGQFTKQNIGLIPILEYSEAQIYRQQAGKRLFDFLAALLLTVFLSPLLLLIAILIRLDSPGPVLYLSKRYGKGGQKFHMFKFRSMRLDADSELDQMKGRNEVDGPIFKMKEDPRVTDIGRILRKYSLDELPQLFNVLKGDMSLVGPRPFPIAQVEKEDLRQLRRLEVRPGITGLWQIRGRSDISFSRLVRWDVWYISNWSFWLDLYILLQTIPVVITAKGAY